MFYRQKILLALLEAFGGKLNSLDLQKHLFLFTQKCQKDKSYDFVPYKYGCFSFQSYADRRNLTEAGHLANSDDWELLSNGYLDSLKKDDAQKIIAFHKYYKHRHGDDLVREVYKDYPYYAINSEIASRIMDNEELSRIEEVRPKGKDYCFFTIGYEGSSFENYLNRLIQSNVALLCDVRRNPLSRKYGFSKKTLSETLAKLGIAYKHIPELGIVSQKRQELKTKSDYNSLFSEYERTILKDNAKALEELYSLLKKYRRVAITCFEEEPCMCHRGRVAKAMSKLPNWEYPIKHL